MNGVTTSHRLQHQLSEIEFREDAGFPQLDGKDPMNLYYTFAVVLEIACVA